MIHASYNTLIAEEPEEVWAALGKIKIVYELRTGAKKLRCSECGRSDGAFIVHTPECETGRILHERAAP